MCIHHTNLYIYIYIYIYTYIDMYSRDFARPAAAVSDRLGRGGWAAESFA